MTTDKFAALHLQEDNDAFSEASDSASSLRQPYHRKPLHHSSLGAGPSNLSNSRRSYPAQGGSPFSSLLARDTTAHTLSNATSTLASSSSADLTQYGADDEGKGEPVAGPGGGLRLHRVDSIGSSSTASLVPDIYSDAPTSSKSRETASGLNLGSLPGPLLGASATNITPGHTTASASTPVAVPPPKSLVKQSSTGPQPKKSSRQHLKDDYLAFPYGSGADSDIQPFSDTSSVSSMGRNPVAGPAPPTMAAVGTAFTRAPNQADSEGHRSGSDTDQGTASPYDGDVEFAARTPVSMQVTNINNQSLGPSGAAVSVAHGTTSGAKDSGTVKQGFYPKTADMASTSISPSHLSTALAAASVSSHGASADVESSVESSSPPVVRGGSHRQTILAVGSPSTPQSFLGAKPAEVKDVPSRVYSSGSTLTHSSSNRGANVQPSFGLDSNALARSSDTVSRSRHRSPDESRARPAEPDGETIRELMQSLNGRSKLTTLFERGHIASSSDSRRPLKIYVQTTFDLPSLEGCSSRLRTAKLSRGRGDTTRDVTVVAGVTDNPDDSTGHTLPLQQRAALARNCRWVDEVVEGVPHLSTLDQSSGKLSADSAHQLQIQRILKDVGADCAARFCDTKRVQKEDSGGEETATGSGRLRTPDASAPEETDRILNLPLF